MSSPEVPPAIDAFFEDSFARPMAHTLPYNWGRLVVSKEADTAYGLVPLSGDVVKGDEPLADSCKNPVEVAFLGPAEIPEPLFNKTAPQEWSTAHGAILTRHTSNRMQVVFGFNRSTDEMVEAELTKAAKQYGVSVEYIRENFKDTEHEAPIEQRLAFEAPNAMLHGVLPMMYQAITEERYRRPQGVLSRLFTRMHGYDLGIEVEAGLIRDDIHASFCRHHFEAQFAHVEETA
jgi:hypothetical protein